MTKHSPVSNTSHAFDWLNDSEMGQLIRAKDWSKTPLGPLNAWSQSLRTSVSLCLASNFPIALAWGEQHIQIYNDGYRSICNAMHPHSMGQDFKVCWASVWPGIGEAFEQAAAGTTAFLVNQRLLPDRSGRLEEAFFTFSFSPIRDEHGHIVGLFHPVIELTQQSLAERRLKVLRALADGTAPARTMDEAIKLTLKTLSSFDLDLPFILFYLFDAGQKKARLAGCCGLPVGSPACPQYIDLIKPAPFSWPLTRILSRRGCEQIDFSDMCFDTVRGTPYGTLLRQAMAIPIIPCGQEQALGVVIAGVSPLRPLDKPYLTFYDMLGKGITDALSNACAYELERSRAEALAEIDRAKTTFFSNVSHEFRTPLTLMLGPLEALSAANLTKTDRQQLDLAYRNARRLLKLVNSLLDFSCIETGRAQALYIPTDLASYTAELASVFRSAIDKAGLTLTIDCPPLPEPVYVDQEMWEKIILNLLSNAFKHTFHGKISVTLRWCEDHIECSVADTGIGIAPEKLSKVFERFTRIRGARSRSHEGTGIGLALVKELVITHGGTIQATSQENEGSMFTILLPTGYTHLPAEQIGSGASPSPRNAAAYVDETMLWLANTPAQDAPAMQTPSTPANHNTRALILLIEDNVDMREYIRRLLEQRYRVIAVSDGEQGIARALAEPPDLVLSDIMMSGLDGFEVLRALRADARTRTVPVILLSAREGEESAIEGRTAGADDYLVKPFSAHELMARVQATLTSAILRREWARELEHQVLERTTALVQTTAALTAAKTEAERANNAKSRFLAAASHDLRQPLSALALYTHMLKNRVAPTERKLLANLQDCVDSLSVLLTDLLDLSKLEAGVVKPNVTDFPVGETLASLVSIHTPEAELKGLCLRCVPTYLMAHTDPVLFKRILGNLIENAVRYTKHGGVLVGCRRRHGKISVEVWDSGVGIAADKTTEIFEEFRQLGDDSRTRGSGLGLAIVAKAAALLDLKIQVRSQPGRGSVFALEVPIGQALQIPAHPPCQIKYRSLRIAFVEDNTLVREALGHALQHAGHEVISAPGGAALLVALNGRVPDIVVSDYRLTEGETGFDVITAVRETLGATLPAILITGDTDPALMRSMVARGILVLNKPLELETLQAYLEDLTHH